MRQRELSDQPAPLANEPEFMLPESKALFLSLGSPTPPELEPYLQRTQKYLPDIRQLPPASLEREIRDTQLHIHQRLLEHRRADIHGLADEEELMRIVDQLTALARRQHAIDEELLHNPERAALR